MTRTQAPIVERVAGWSARHRKTAVFGWLLLVVAAVVIGQQLGTSNTSSYDPGQAGQAERVLNRPVVQQPASESVLIQGRSATQTYQRDPELRQAVGQVVAALRAQPDAAADIQSPLTSPGLVGAGPGGGRSALVTFNVAGKPANDDQAVVPALNAVAAIAKQHPGLTIEEAGGASLDRATGSITGRDFRKAEVTSIPVSLVLLLVVFGALIAAGIPLLLAGTAVISAISLLAIPSRWLPIGSTTSSIVLLVGMAGLDGGHRVQRGHHGLVVLTRRARHVEGDQRGAAVHQSGARDRGPDIGRGSGDGPQGGHDLADRLPHLRVAGVGLTRGA